MKRVVSAALRPADICIKHARLNALTEGSVLIHIYIENEETNVFFYIVH